MKRALQLILAVEIVVAVVGGVVAYRHAHAAALLESSTTELERLLAEEQTLRVREAEARSRVEQLQHDKERLTASIPHLEAVIAQLKEDNVAADAKVKADEAALADAGVADAIVDAGAVDVDAGVP